MGQLSRRSLFGASAETSSGAHQFPGRAEENVSEDSELPFHICSFRAENARPLGGCSLFSRMCLQEGCETKDA